MAKKEFELKDLADGSSNLCMAARINDKGDAEVIVHGTDDTKEATYKMIIMLAMLVAQLEKKTGYDSSVLWDATTRFLEKNYPDHREGCLGIDDID